MRLELAPQLDRPFQRLAGLRQVALRHLHRSSRVRRGRLDRDAAVPLGQGSELIGGPARRREIPGRESDLDLRRQERHAVKPAVRGSLPGRLPARLVEGAADRGGRRRHFPLGQAQERQGWLRISTEGMRPLECILCRREVSPPTPEIADLVQRQPDRGGNEPPQLLGRAPRLCLRLQPGAAHLLDLGTVQAAHPREAVDPLPSAPAILCVGPFRRSPPVAERGACPDRAARDGSCRARLQLPCDGGHGRLVKQRQPFLDVTPGHQQRSLGADRGRLEITVADTERDLLGSRGVRDSFLCLANQRRMHGAHRGKPAVSRPLVHRVEQPLRAAQPRARHRARQPQQIVAGEPDGDRRGGRPVAALHRRCVCPLTGVDGGRQLADPPGSLGQQLELVRGQHPV
jgi:hypothetical protein